MGAATVFKDQGPLRYVLLHGRHAVLIELLDAVRFQTSYAMRLELEADTRYSAKQLCGHAFWNQLNRRERLLAGSCLAHLVSEGELPLERVNAFKKYPNVYRLTDALDSP